MPETVLALHPNPKKSATRVNKEKYQLIRAAILAAFRAEGQIAFKDLEARVKKHLSAPFEGSLSWYTTTIKLDLEARGLIERIPGESPQQLRMVKK